MPRRLPVRPGKLLGNIFVLAVTCVMLTIYYEYVAIWIPRAAENPWVLVLLVVFNLLFVLMVWSFVQTMTTDPG